MKLWLLTFALFLGMVTANAQKSESSKPKPDTPTVPLCNLLRNHETYSGKEVRVRALYASVFEMSALTQSECDSDEYSTWLEFDLSSIESSTKPEILKKFNQVMERDIDEQWVLFETELLVTGVLDKSKAGYGHLGMYRYLFTVKSIEDVGETKKTHPE